MEATHDLVQSKLMLMFSTAILAGLINYQAWKKGYYQHQDHSDSGEVGLWDVVWAFATFLILQLVVLPLLAWIWFYPEFSSGNGTALMDPTLQGWLNYGAIVLVAFGLLIYSLWLNRRTRKFVWGTGTFEVNNWKHYLMGVLTWFISFPIVVLASQLISFIVSMIVPEYSAEQTAVKQLKDTSENPALFWSMVVIIITVVPLIEELLFRGYLQTWIKGHLGYKWAIVITAVIFAMFHFTTMQGIGNIELLASLFILALFLGWIYERERSLLASIGLHSTFNALSIGMIIFGI